MEGNCKELNKNFTQVINSTKRSQYLKLKKKAISSEIINVSTYHYVFFCPRLKCNNVSRRKRRDGDGTMKRTKKKKQVKKILHFIRLHLLLLSSFFFSHHLLSGEHKKNDQMECFLSNPQNEYDYKAYLCLLFIDVICLHYHVLMAFTQLRPK